MNESLVCPLYFDTALITSFPLFPPLLLSPILLFLPSVPFLCSVQEGFEAPEAAAEADEF